MKMTLIAGILCLSATGLYAVPYLFSAANGTDVWIDVESWYGSGANETILVVDWNRIDNGPGTHSESHAFGYRWDGIAYESDLLRDLHDAGILAVSTGYGGAFVYNIAYDHGDEVHMHTEEGSWLLASTADPYARWGSWGDSEWDFNQAGCNQELLGNGLIEGVNATVYFGVLPDYADDQLTIPFVPEPASLTLVAIGSLLLCRRRSA